GIACRLPPFSRSLTRSRWFCVKTSWTAMPSAPPMRAKAKTMSPINARSRSPACVEVSMLSSSARASDGSSTGVCPDVTTCRGPRTDAAGVTGTTWPVTSQSKRWRIAASRCLTLGAASSRVLASIQVATCTGCTAVIDGAGIRAPAEEFLRGAGIGPARVRIADVGGEEFEEAHAGALAGGGDQRRDHGRRGMEDELVHRYRSL